MLLLAWELESETIHKMAEVAAILDMQHYHIQRTGLHQSGLRGALGRSPQAEAETKDLSITLDNVSREQTDEDGAGMLSREGEESGDSLAAWHTTVQPVTEKSLKVMLLSLKDMQADYHCSTTKLKGQVEALEERVDHVEWKMAEYSTTINELVDGHQGAY